MLSHPDFTGGTYSTALLSQIASQGEPDLSDEGERETVAALTAAFGSLFGDRPGYHLSPWKAAGRAEQMIPRLGRGGRW